jgi:hypothetical protein
MSSHVAFRVFVANTNATNVDEVLDFVESRSADVSTFRKPPGRGPHMAAGDYLLVLNTAGSIASIAGIIWMAYDKFIAAKKDRDSNAGIILHLAPSNPDIQINFWLGDRQKTQEEFTADFVEQVSAVTDAKDSSYHESIDAVMSGATSWIPRAEYVDPPASELRLDDAEMEQLSRMVEEMSKSREVKEGK